MLPDDPLGLSVAVLGATSMAVIPDSTASRRVVTASARLVGPTLGRDHRHRWSMRSSATIGPDSCFPSSVSLAVEVCRGREATQLVADCQSNEAQSGQGTEENC